METIVADIIQNTITVWIDAAFYLILGFFLAGVMSTFWNPDLVYRHLGKNRISSVILAALFGIPLPLCSCGVLPTAIGLRKQGASKGATVSFLISTPETGIDSVAVTYALLDLPMTIFRPFAALLTALVAGFVTNIIERNSHDSPAPLPAPDERHDAEHCACDCAEADACSSSQKPQSRIRRILHFSFIELLDDLSYWLLFSLVLSGVIAALIPENFFRAELGSGLLTMALMILIGIPLYVCDISVTPIAAAMMLKGLSPGAALVFLLCGPATNITSITMIGRFLGKRTVAIYLTSIISVSILMGFLLNGLYSFFQFEATITMGQAQELVPQWLKLVSAWAFVLIMGSSFMRLGYPPSVRRLFAGIEARWHIRLTQRRIGLGFSVVFLICYLLTGFFTVKPGQAGVVKRFGRIVETNLKPGLHYRWPYPLEQHELVDEALIRREQVIETVSEDSSSDREECLLLTADENLVELSYSVFYQVNDVVQFRYGLEQPNLVVREFTASSLREIVATLPIDAVLTERRGDLEDWTSSLLQQRLTALTSGIEVVDFHFNAIHAPNEVHYAFRDIASAQEDAVTSLNLAELYKNKLLSNAQGRAAELLEQARSQYAEAVAEATGKTAAFTVRAESYNENPIIHSLRLRHEYYRTILPVVAKILVPADAASAGADVWLFRIK